MATLSEFVEGRLLQGRAYFSKVDAQEALGTSPRAIQAALARMAKKGRLVSPWRGFYLILRSEDRVLGAPDPSRWIDRLMKYLAVDYRISLLRAAAFHGSSHQAAMVFQVIAPRQLHKLEIGRQRIEFVYQAPAAFRAVNRHEWLAPLKTESGFAQVAGVELTLLDACRYFHHAGGMNGVAQMVHDLGKQASPRILADAALAYENSSVRRLGYLLEHFGHLRAAKAIRRFAAQAKSFKPLDPSSRPIVAGLTPVAEPNRDWKLTINVPLEIDA